MFSSTMTAAITIPPEIFPLIASFIPLRSAPRTLLSLSLGNSHFYEIVRPLLYSRLILRNEDDAIAVMQRIMGEQQLGLAVTELYVISELSLETRQGKKPFDVVRGLQMLVEKRLLPRLFALGIYLLKDWDYDENHKPIDLHGRLLADFWKNLRTHCPRLHSLALRNVGPGERAQWMSGPVIDEINSILGLTVLRLEWWGGCVSEDDCSKILNNLPRLASSLHTLSLKSCYQAPNPLLCIDFPHLKCLSLHHFESNDDTPTVMDFFRRHPQLESLTLLCCRDIWFSNDIEVGFLPNLKHLKARFDDIRALVPILPQLISLAFTASYNGQIPYLLRAVLPNGLPQLKSLEIEQEEVEWDYRELKGVLWYETLDGGFRTEKKRRKVPRDLMDGFYMNSIVRGAPNLEELGLHGMTLHTEHLRTLAPTLSRLTHMKRFYYRGHSLDYEFGEEQLADFLDSTEALARECRRLESVTSISSRYPPYISAVIERDSVGDVIGVRSVEGMGMMISAYEDEPFPVTLEIL